MNRGDIMQFLSNAVVLTCLSWGSVLAQSGAIQLLGEFESGWEEAWVERKVVEQMTTYEVVQERDDTVLQATSASSASALWRPLDLKAGKIGKISWAWKVERALSKDTRERTKLGDDYAARVYVVFGPSLVSWRTRALCYVWSANQPVDSHYRSPYTNSVAMVVLRSGGEAAGKWVEEERNFITDYKRVFGGEPELITGVAVMVDTDNSRQSVRAWFDDLRIELGTVKKTTDDEKPRIIFQN